VFCKLWGIDILVDDNLFNIRYGGQYRIRVFYPLTDQKLSSHGAGAQGFETFDQLKPWITE
jgi:hypothetical protein